MRKKIAGFTTTKKGGYWIRVFEPIPPERGKGSQCGQYHINGVDFNEALAEAGLKAPEEIIGLGVTFDANNNFASSAKFYPNAQPTK